MDISKQNILITGAMGAIGKFLVSSFSTIAKNVIAVDIVQSDNTFDILKNVKYFTCDLSDQNQSSTVFKDITSQFDINILINNAGIIYSEPLINILKKDNKRHNSEMWHRTTNANINTTFTVGSLIAEHMVEKKIKGLIINVSSISASGNAGQSAYSASKAAINALSVTWAKELGMFGIRCAAIAPGFFNTESTKNAISEAVVKKWISQTPINRMGNPEELLSAFRFIIENDFYNGRTLEIDGGLRI